MKWYKWYDWDVGKILVPIGLLNAVLASIFAIAMLFDWIRS